MVQVTYQKNDGCIIKRLRNTMLPYKVGETTSMGWKVLNIEYKYKDKYYSAYKYNVLIQKNKQATIKKKQTIELIVRETKTLIYYFGMLIILDFLKMLLGV